jgi:hypothetical protein
MANGEQSSGSENETGPTKTGLFGSKVCLGFMEDFY